MPHKNADERRAWAAQYRAANRERIRAYQTKYLALNQESRAATVKASNASQRSIERKAEYRERSRESLRAAGREYVRANRAKLNAALARYRAAKLQATPAWADRDAIEVFYAEARRLSEAHAVPYHVDHIYPLVSPIVCGLHVQANLQILIGVENQRKGNRVCQ